MDDENCGRFSAANPGVNDDDDDRSCDVCPPTRDSNDARNCARMNADDFVMNDDDDDRDDGDHDDGHRNDVDHVRVSLREKNDNAGVDRRFDPARENAYRRHRQHHRRHRVFDTAGDDAHDDDRRLSSHHDSWTDAYSMANGPRQQPFRFRKLRPS